MSVIICRCSIYIKWWQSPTNQIKAKKTKIKINLQLSVWVFIMLVLHGNVNIKFLLDSQTVYCKFLAKIIVYKQFIVTQSCWKYTFTKSDFPNRFKTCHHYMNGWTFYKLYSLILCVVVLSQAGGGGTR